MSDSSIDVLAIGAHPDDVEMSVGGILVKLASIGYRTAVLDLTRGEMGTRGTAAVREKEAAEAARILRVVVRENLELPDSQVWCDDQSRGLMVRALRRLRPRMVLTHHWEDPHPDHVQTSQIVREASHLAGLAKYDAQAGQERHRPASLAYFLFPRTVVPSFVVDISDFFAQKMEAILAHGSQLHDPKRKELETIYSDSEFLPRLEDRFRYYGSLISAKYGEPVFVKQALNVHDPVQLLTRPMNLYS